MGDRDRLAALLHELFCDEVCRYDPDLGEVIHRELAEEADALLLLGVGFPDDRLREAALEVVAAWDGSVVNGDVEPAVEALRAALGADR